MGAKKIVAVQNKSNISDNCYLSLMLVGLYYKNYIMKKVFFVLCVLGVILPYYQLFLFLNSSTPTLSYFINEIYSSHPVSMITWDITVAYFSFLSFLIYKKVNNGLSISKYILASFVGFSLALPLYLYDNYNK